eukprot:429582_1
MSAKLHMHELADKNSKYSVLGFTRRIESELSLTIPLPIKYLCLNYLLIYERFKIHGTNIELNQNTNTVKSLGEERDIVYGNVDINLDDDTITKYIWTFKILNDYVNSRRRFFVGIDSSGKSLIDINSHSFFGFSSESISINDDNLWYTVEDEIWNSLFHNPYTWQKVDTIKITLNMDTQNMVLYVNSDKKAETRKIPFENTTYNFAVIISHTGHGITLTQFQTEKIDI